VNGLINIRVEDKEPEVQATAQASDILHEEEETDKGSKVSKFFHFFFTALVLLVLVYVVDSAARRIDYRN